MKKALVVGIDDYPNAPLKGCVNDAEAIAKALERNQDQTKNFDVRLEKNIPSGARLLSAVNDLFQGDADIALLYFSGHGSEDGMGYLVTPDYAPPIGGVSMADILSCANKSKCRNKIIILDSCYSGRLGENPVFEATSSELAEGVTIMTASSRDQVSLEINGHGVFTGLLLQGLAGGAADLTGKISPASLYAFIDQSLGPWEQRPVFKTNTTAFLSIRSVQPQVPMTTLRIISKIFEEPTAEFGLDPSYEDTNAVDIDHKVVKPYAVREHVDLFKKLQSLEGVGLVEPVGEDFMYFAAMHNKSCRLTPLGMHYWKLSKDRRF